MHYISKYNNHTKTFKDMTTAASDISYFSEKLQTTIQIVIMQITSVTISIFKRLKYYISFVFE